MANTDLKALKGLEIREGSPAAVRRKVGKRSGEFCLPNGEAGMDNRVEAELNFSP